MTTPLSLNDRIKGCLIGAAVGVELDWARRVHPEKFDKAGPNGVFNLRLEPAGPLQQHPQRIGRLKLTPLIELGIRAYVNKQGRVTPEDFGRELMNDRKIAQPVFNWDVFHTTQELLKEGCHPRISGLGTAPAGLIAAAMPAVGIFHHGDPDYAYLDGVELASVNQPRLGADWSGLAAAAVAAAFDPDLDADDLISAVLKLAHENNKEVYYELNSFLRSKMYAGLFTKESKTETLNNWYYNVGQTNCRRKINWLANNPLATILPLLGAFDRDPQKLMALLLWAPNYGETVSTILAGAILGARNGRTVFPENWLRWAEPIANDWFPIARVVEKRQRQEKEVVEVCEKLVRQKRNGMSLVEDKIYGCLLASSIGNAMGSPVECMQYEEIDAKYPGGVKTVLEPKRLESEDDNQMAMLLVETYMQREGRPVMARHFGQTWYDRLNRDHFFPLCMGNSYDLIRAGWDSRITGHWNQVTGSTVMCMEPVGIYHLADPDYAAIDATAISYMYQRGLDVTAATILAATVAEALRPDATVDRICAAALKAAPKEPWRTFDKRKFKSGHDYIEACLNVAEKYDDVLKARKELYAKCLLYHMIDPLELLGLALAMFKIAKGDVRQAAIGGTNIGRDSDTIAGRAAMLSGALRGSANVPKEWVRMFRPAVLQRIRRCAKRLADLVANQKMAILRKRQA
jgi:ADP-ribosylglycohydrolase